MPKLTLHVPEDAVLHEAAAQANANCIVTRNVKDFAKARLPVCSPAQFSKALEE